MTSPLPSSLFPVVNHCRCRCHLGGDDGGGNDDNNNRCSNTGVEDKGRVYGTDNEEL